MAELEALLKRQGVTIGEPRTSSLISIGPLESVINAAVAQTNQMAEALASLQERSVDFLTKDDGRKQDHKLMDLSSQQQALAKRFDKNLLSIEHLIDDVPKRLAAHDQKLQFAEEMHTLELQKTRNELMARLKLAETTINQRAPMADFRALTREVEDRTRVSETKKLQDVLFNVRDETIARVDDCAERSFAQRKDLDEKMGAIEKTSGNILRGLETKSAKLDSQIAEVNTFMHRAERALHSKVSVENMQGVKDQLLDSFRNSHSQLSDKTARLKGRVDVAETELARAHEALQAKGSQSSVDELSALADHLRLSVDEINAQLETKAAAGEVLPRLSSLEATVLEHASGMASKADAATISNRHELHVADMAMNLDRLTGRSDEVHKGLVAVHAAVEEFAAPERRAAQRDIAAESGREALKKVATLQDELGGRVTIIEEWMEQHPSSKSRRAQMKLQRRPGAKEEDGSPHTAESLGDEPYKEPAGALQLDSIEPSHGALLHRAAAEMARLNNTVATQQASLEFLREEVHVLRSMLAAALDNGHVLGAASQAVGHGAPSLAMGAPDGGAVAGAIGPLAAAAGGVPGGGLGQSHALDGDRQHSATPCGPTPSAPAEPWSTGRILPSQQPQAWATPQPTARARQPSPPRQQQTLAEPPHVPISGPTYVPGPMLPAQQEHSAIVQSALRAAHAAADAASAGKPAGSSGSLGAGTGGSPPSARGHHTASPRNVRPSPGCGRAEECPTGPVPTWMGAPSVGLHGALPTDTGTTELIRIDMSGSVALPIGANDGQRFPELAARTPVPHVPRGADPYYEQHRPPQMRARHAGGDVRPVPPPSSATGSPRSQAAARSSSPGRPHQVFKNEPEKRAWMLKEKRKAVIEDRLGPQPWGDGDAGHYDVAHDVLPPISSSAGFSDAVRAKGGPL